MGFPLVGTGVKKALYKSLPSYFSRSPRARLLTLPAARLLRLLLRLRLFPFLSEFFFFSVPPRDGVKVCDCDMTEFDLRMELEPGSPSMYVDSGRFASARE